MKTKILHISFVLTLSVLAMSGALASLGALDGGPVRVHAQGGSNPGKNGQLVKLSNPVTEAEIIIDPLREGWEKVIPYPDDPPRDNGEAGNIDWRTISMAHDFDELYVRYEVDDGPPFGSEYRVFIDIDRDRSTGFIGSFGQLSIGADVLFEGRFENETHASVFHYTGGSGTSWSWSPPIDNSFNEQELSGTKRDIEWKTPISDLDVFGTGVTSFNWVASRADGANDSYPDGGNNGAGGEFHTYTVAVPNPERGFYHDTETHSNNYTPLELPPLQSYRENEGITLIRRYFFLEDFVESDISQEYLDNMQEDFDTVRQAGLKMVVRFAYSADTVSGPCDASKEWILRHIEQLGPILQANSDIIAVVQAGFIGAWGEWWTSCHFTPDSDWDDRREVLFALLDVLPITRMVQLRTPRYKQIIFTDTSHIRPYEAHSGTRWTRTGHHNDCFLSSVNDYGTYVYTPTEYIYLRNDTNYVVMGGETCIPDPPDYLDRLKCQTALKELVWFHWSYLNLDWYTPNLQMWREQGCFTEIEQRLGYRFVFLEGTYDNWVKPGGDFHFNIQLINEGFAAPFNPRAVELILRHPCGGLTYVSELPDDRQFDPRFWLPGEIHTISHTINIPSNLPAGIYEILLNLPDPEPRLHDRPEYAIRLAGSTWEASTGYNKLRSSVCFYLPIVMKDYPPD